jgi:hypothetical protein
MRANLKASALFDLAANVASLWDPCERSHRRLPVCAFRFARVASAAGVASTQLSGQDTLSESAEDSINHFIGSIIPVHQMEAIHANDMLQVGSGGGCEARARERARPGQEPGEAVFRHP